MIKKVVQQKVAVIVFERAIFWTSLIVVLLTIILYAFFRNGPDAARGMIAILLLIEYFLPSIIAYDLGSFYEKRYNAPEIKHPKRSVILALNVFLGMTFLGWLVSLKMACSPGLINYNSVEYVNE